MVKILIVLIAINLVFYFSVHKQGQNSKTISKNKSMHLSITVVKLSFSLMYGFTQECNGVGTRSYNCLHYGDVT